MSLEKECMPGVIIKLYKTMTVQINSYNSGEWGINKNYDKRMQSPEMKFLQ
jgi:hypothetical protein